MSAILGIDIGGSGIKGAPVDTSTGQLLSERVRIPTPEGARPADVKDVVRQLVEHFGLPGAVGVTFPGIVQHGHTLSAANVDKGWIGLDADTLFTEASGHDVHLINDADAAGLAEAKFGAGAGVQGTVMVLTFGTGIGSALILNGTLIPNTELGHLWLRDKHAETWASDRARELDDLNWKQWARRVSTYLQHLELLFSPDLFVIGGGVSKRPEKWLPHLQLSRSRVVPAQLQNEAGIVGAAMMAAQPPGRPERPAGPLVGQATVPRKLKAEAALDKPAGKRTAPARKPSAVKPKK
ncbi:polyphosphate glucokinase [Deinococcus metalli]|uniref:Polyphosphate glucokinase n=1 Tax=Deinococcus metalli TaxID=1141878 RepID=A0A7W8KGS4_9DEIO|nr:ROK family protein [Deinococcus metalli]MBB5377837.1 polyphosphate glucokinase [Deinococcus metalli]GHF55574.1 polyphosphate glucokinase [Deinococcus metalli]